MARKLCSICNTRPVGSGKGLDPQHARVMGYCTPCLSEGEWENIHNDDGHGTEGEGSNSTEDCWVCHPELNEAQKAYVKRETKGHRSPRREQLSHLGCYHSQEPDERRKCRNAFWATGASHEEFPAFVAKRWTDAGYVVRDGAWVKPAKWNVNPLGPKGGVMNQMAKNKPAS